MTHPVTIERLDAALDKMALIIEAYGDAYVPIYERLERERDAMARGERIRSRAVRAQMEAQSA